LAWLTIVSLCAIAIARSHLVTWPSSMHWEMESNNDNILEQLSEAENSYDIEKMLSLMTDDVIIEDVPFGTVMKAKEGV
jgi:hypothetical protein